MAKSNLFFIYVIIAIFGWTAFFPNTALSYSTPSSADIPVHHWSYEAIERLAVAGLLGLSGIDTKPMTRVQIAYKIKEAIDNIEEERLPYYLSLDREYVEYLQHTLYKLINEFRQELVLVGATVAQLEAKEEQKILDKYLNYNLGSPVKVEQRFVNVKSRKDLLLENENGLRLEEGYNLRARAYPWVNAFNLFSVSATPTAKARNTHTDFFLEEAAAKFSIFNIELAAAKSAMWWGPGFHGSMLMSNNAEPLSLARIRTVNNFRLPGVLTKLGSFGVNFFISKLEKDRNIPEPMFAGLRLEWSPLPRLSLGASRTSIMDGKGRPKPRGFKDYWKIFIARGKDEFTSAASEAKRTDTDQLASLDLKFAMPLRPEMCVASGLEIYGEWAGEDRFSFWENESPGFLMGLFLTDILRNKGTDFRIEYAKNKPAWYTHGIYNAAGSGTAYTYKGEIMGHHMGGDADDLFFRISKELKFLSTPYFDTVKAGAQLDLERHGLSLGTQEKLVEVVVDVLWTHSDTVGLSLRYEFEDYKNFNYVSGKSSRNHIVLMETDIKF